MSDWNYTGAKRGAVSPIRQQDDVHAAKPGSLFPSVPNRIRNAFEFSKLSDENMRAQDGSKRDHPGKGRRKQGLLFDLLDSLSRA